LISSAGTAAEFRSGKVGSCITDIRGAGDLDRAQIAGKCPYFEAEPAEGDIPLVQYLGLAAQIDEAKRPYCEGFIRSVITEGSQAKLAGIGLLPIRQGLEMKFDRAWLGELYARFDPRAVPPCFG
ncbi:MAG: hypothetical protein J6P98_02040, partial [Clostridia bacterium]|nr:hypothetical protein [Clostridia bacterium]